MRTPSKSQDYYARHQTRLQQRARDRQYVKRTGRRKVSKAERAALEDKRCREINGTRGTYTNSIAMKICKGCDPLLKARGLAVERSRRTALLAKLTLWRSHHVDWHTRYQDELESLLRQALDRANAYRAEAGSAESNPFFRYSEDTLHHYRRLIAGYHQELDLFQQGERAYAAAVEDGIMIFEGHCVNRVAFQRLYGW